jgi:hypothetical protein
MGWGLSGSSVGNVNGALLKLISFVGEACPNAGPTKCTDPTMEIIEGRRLDL